MAIEARIRQILARNGLLIAVFIGLLGLAAIGGAVYTYTNPPVETVTETTNEQQVSTDVGTSAIVQENSSLYETGRELRNMPVYFFNGTPELTFHINTSTPGDTQTQVTHRLVFVMKATRGGEEFFSSRKLINAQKTTVSDGLATSSATVNMTALRSTIREKQVAVGGVGNFQVYFQLNVSYDTGRYSGSLGAQSPLILTETAYWLDADLAADRSHSVTETRRIEQAPNLTAVGTLGGTGLALLLGAVVLYRLSQELDIDQIEVELAHAEYEEWVSNGQIPTQTEKEYVRTDSLEDLVDIAIDSNKRVIYDRSIEAYGVIQDDLIYLFTTDEEMTGDWIDL